LLNQLEVVEGRDEAEGAGDTDLEEAEEGSVARVDEDSASSDERAKVFRSVVRIA